jgi:hypothetical protein
MATVLSPGDLAIVQYNSSTTDSFTFVFARDIEAGTVVNFTDNGWAGRRWIPAGRRHNHLHGAHRDYRRYRHHADGPQS